MKYLFAVLVLVLGCGSSNLVQSNSQKAEDDTEISGINTNARTDHQNDPKNCPSTFEYFSLNGDMFEVEVPGLCAPYLGDRGDPPDTNHNPGVIVERSNIAEHVQ